MAEWLLGCLNGCSSAWMLKCWMAAVLRRMNALLLLCCFWKWCGWLCFAWNVCCCWAVVVMMPCCSVEIISNKSVRKKWEPIRCQCAKYSWMNDYYWPDVRINVGQWYNKVWTPEIETANEKILCHQLENILYLFFCELANHFLQIGQSENYFVTHALCENQKKETRKEKRECRKIKLGSNFRPQFLTEEIFAFLDVATRITI